MDSKKDIKLESEERKPQKFELVIESFAYTPSKRNVNMKASPKKEEHEFKIGVSSAIHQEDRKIKTESTGKRRSALRNRPTNTSNEVSHEPFKCKQLAKSPKATNDDDEWIADEKSSSTSFTPLSSPVPEFRSQGSRKRRKFCSGSPSKAPSSKSESKKARGYAPPEIYSHLKNVPDRLGPGLDVLFCGINPGIESSKQGHHFAYRGNNFYKMIYGAGFTSKLIPASEDETLPGRYNVGIINLVDRPSSSESELSKNEMLESVPAMIRKVASQRPRAVCFIGKGMCGKVETVIKQEIEKDLSSPSRFLELRKVTTQIGLRPFKIMYPDGRTDSDVKETLFFCSHSSSGLATSTTLREKINNLKELKSILTSEVKVDTSNFWIIPSD